MLQISISVLAFSHKLLIPQKSTASVRNTKISIFHNFFFRILCTNLIWHYLEQRRLVLSAQGPADDQQG